MKHIICLPQRVKKYLMFKTFLIFVFINLRFKKKLKLKYRKQNWMQILKNTHFLKVAEPIAMMPPGNLLIN
jgi:hypothetical protein